MRSDDIQPFNEYQAHLARHHQRIRKTRRPLFVTKDGRASAVVLSPEAYDELAERAMLAADIEMLQRGLAESKAGRGRDAKEVLREIAARHGVQWNP